MSLFSKAGTLFAGKKDKPVEVPDPLAPLADTHGHLTSFHKTEPAVALARAALAGVRLLIVPVDPSDDVPCVEAFLSWFFEQREAARELLRTEREQTGAVPTAFSGWDVPDLLDNVHFLAGVHPYGAARYADDPAVEERLRSLLSRPECVGVGEFGLDYGPWSELAPEVQLPVFRRQLRLAHEFGLPVELHIRDANDDEGAQAHVDALRVLEEEGVPQAGCDLHCFTSGPQVMQPFVELGCHIAFGGAMTFGRSDDIRQAAVLCPSAQLLSETDCPYMAPVPLRGRECEPAMVAFTAARLAEVRHEALDVPVETTYAMLWRNACGFFKLC